MATPRRAAHIDARNRLGFGSTVPKTRRNSLSNHGRLNVFSI